MSCDKAAVENTGAIWAADLDDCAQKCLNLIGKKYTLESDEEIQARAKEVVKLLAPEQKYVRGAFSGGTFMDEAMHALIPKTGPIYSNCPLREVLQTYSMRRNTAMQPSPATWAVAVPSVPFRMAGVLTPVSECRWSPD